VKEQVSIDPWLDRGALHSVKRLTRSTVGSAQNRSDTMIKYDEQKKNGNTSKKKKGLIRLLTIHTNNIDLQSCVKACKLTLQQTYWKHAIKS